jgi:hypothetical protein
MPSQISTIYRHIASFQINGYSLFRDPGFRSFNSQTLLSSIRQSSGVDNPRTRVPLKLTVEISFRSPDSGDFKYQLLVSSELISSEMEDLLKYVLFNPMTALFSGTSPFCILIFQFLFARLPSEHFTQSLLSSDTYPLIDRRIPATLRLQPFDTLALCDFSPS